MRGNLLILRPQPGAGETAAAAHARGLATVVAPLFHVRAIDWDVPAADEWDAVMFTSANALRHAGARLADLVERPCYAVGERTAMEARAVGFHDVRMGSSDGGALVAMMERAGVRSPLHLCGAAHIPLHSHQIRIRSVPVYHSVAREVLPMLAVEALASDSTLALIHSPRAGSLFASLCDKAGIKRSRTAIVAISKAALQAAGPGWRLHNHATRPRDDALLELAAALCEAGGGTGRT